MFFCTTKDLCWDYAYAYRMTSMVLYCVQYHWQNYTLKTFLTVCVLLHVRDFSPVFLRIELQWDWMSRRRWLIQSDCDSFVSPSERIQSYVTDRQTDILLPEKISHYRLICHRNERDICTCIYKIVNLLKSYDNVNGMTYTTKIMLTG